VSICVGESEYLCESERVSAWEGVSICVGVSEYLCGRE